ncbi:MAG: putative zinc-binding metallopeptidase [Planctomycetota bacterium]
MGSLSLYALEKTPPARARRRRKYWWSALSDEELLDVPLSRLGLEIEGSPLEGRLRRLCDDLGRAGIDFRPNVWLSIDWFCPDGSTGFAIPFHLADARLMALERKMVFEVEGGTSKECLRLLRHETGHAIEHAYHLRRRRDWRARFGRASRSYGDTYRANPLSRQCVVHLEGWYAQSHPLEDWCETFAVLVGEPRTWRKRYADWPALRKLLFIEELVDEIGKRPPPHRSTERLDPLSKLKGTLGDHYREKKRREFAEDLRTDERLASVFEQRPRRSRRDSAAGFLRAYSRDLVGTVVSGTRIDSYVVEQALKEMIRGCRRLGLAADRGDRATTMRAVALLSAISNEMLTSRNPVFAR